MRRSSSAGLTHQRSYKGADAGYHTAGLSHGRAPLCAPLERRIGSVGCECDTVRRCARPALLSTATSHRGARTSLTSTPPLAVPHLVQIRRRQCGRSSGGRLFNVVRSSRRHSLHAHGHTVAWNGTSAPHNNCSQCPNINPLAPIHIIPPHPCPAPRSGYLRPSPPSCLVHYITDYRILRILPVIDD